MRELSNIEIGAVSGGSTGSAIADNGGAIAMVGNFIANTAIDLANGAVQTVAATVIGAAQLTSAVWQWFFGAPAA
ncbi:MAG: hypothetical protein LBU72_00350 [Burkholderiaceae bacterium]|jgi:hypothetical protein|nr:hypothetical protein [Burkholderiaceae bacterium]